MVGQSCSGDLVNCVLFCGRVVYLIFSMNGSEKLCTFQLILFRYHQQGGGKVVDYCLYDNAPDVLLQPSWGIKG